MNVPDPIIWRILLTVTFFAGSCFGTLLTLLTLVLMGVLP
jgi:hypothetical protein